MVWSHYKEGRYRAAKPRRETAEYAKHAKHAEFLLAVFVPALLMATENRILQIPATSRKMLQFVAV